MIPSILLSSVSLYALAPACLPPLFFSTSSISSSSSSSASTFILLALPAAVLLARRFVPAATAVDLTDGARTGSLPFFLVADGAGDADGGRVDAAFDARLVALPRFGRSGNSSSSDGDHEAGISEGGFRFRGFGRGRLEEGVGLGTETETETDDGVAYRESGVGEKGKG